MQLDTDKVVKAGQRVQKDALDKTRDLTRDFAKEAGPFADEALAIGAAALTAAVSYAKTVGVMKAGSWAVQVARRNPVVVGLSVLGLAGATVYALSRRSSVV